MTDDTDPERALRAHLSRERPTVDFDCDRLDLGIDGWAFFRIRMVDARDEPPRNRVVRGDGTVVTDDPAAELGRLFRSMGALDDEDPPAAPMARAATALLSDTGRPVYAERVDWLQHSYDPAPSAPEVRRTDGGLTLSFHAEVGGGGPRPTLEAFEVRVGPDYDVEWEQWSPGSEPDPG